MRKSAASRRWQYSLAAVFCALAASTALGGESGWDGMMRDAGVIVDHQPHNFGGGAADTSYRENIFLPPTWQLIADDFSLPEPGIVNRVNFWGFYHLNSLPTQQDETFRVRFYDSRPVDGLPGQLLHEQSSSAVSRMHTGRSIITSGAPSEFLFVMDLAQPFFAPAGPTLWLEVVQVGDADSVFRWEFSRSAEVNGQAFNNPIVGDWTAAAPTTSDTAFQLISIPEPDLLVPFGLLFFLLLRRPSSR